MAPTTVTYSLPVGRQTSSERIGNLHLCASIPEVGNLIPASYRDKVVNFLRKMHDFAIKRAHASVQVSSLEKHKSSNTFPPALLGVKDLECQVSRDYGNTVPEFNSSLHEATADYRSAQLDEFIAIKKAEVTWWDTHKLSYSAYKTELHGVIDGVKATIDKCHNGYEGAPRLGEDEDMAEATQEDAPGDVRVKPEPDWVQVHYKHLLEDAPRLVGRVIELGTSKVLNEQDKKEAKKAKKAEAERNLSSENNDNLITRLETSIDKKLQSAIQKLSAKSKDKGQLTESPLHRPAGHGVPTSLGGCQFADKPDRLTEGQTPNYLYREEKQLARRSRYQKRKREEYEAEKEEERRVRAKEEAEKNVVAVEFFWPNGRQLADCLREGSGGRASIGRRVFISRKG